MDNITLTNPDIFLVWFEEGRYTQRRYYVKTQEDAQNLCNRLNEEWGVNPDEDPEYWTWSRVESYYP